MRVADVGPRSIFLLSMVVGCGGSTATGGRRACTPEEQPPSPALVELLTEGRPQIEILARGPDGDACAMGGWRLLRAPDGDRFAEEDFAEPVVAAARTDAGYRLLQADGTTWRAESFLARPERVGRIALPSFVATGPSSGAIAVVSPAPLGNLHRVAPDATTERVPGLPDGAVVAGAFAGAAGVLAVLDGGLLVTSDDAGGHWRVVRTPRPARAVRVLGERRFVGVSDDPLRPGLLAWHALEGDAVASTASSWLDPAGQAAVYRAFAQRLLGRLRRVVLPGGIELRPVLRDEPSRGGGEGGQAFDRVDLATGDSDRIEQIPRGCTLLPWGDAAAARCPGQDDEHVDLLRSEDGRSFQSSGITIPARTELHLSVDGSSLWWAGPCTSRDRGTRAPGVGAHPGKQEAEGERSRVGADGDAEPAEEEEGEEEEDATADDGDDASPAVPFCVVLDAEHPRPVELTGFREVHAVAGGFALGAPTISRSRGDGDSSTLAVVDLRSRRRTPITRDERWTLRGASLTADATVVLTERREDGSLVVRIGRAGRRLTVRELPSGAREVAFSDAERGLAVGSDASRIWRTFDGGGHWERLRPAVDGDPARVRIGGAARVGVRCTPTRCSAGSADELRPTTLLDVRGWGEPRSVGPRVLAGRGREPPAPPALTDCRGAEPGSLGLLRCESVEETQLGTVPRTGRIRGVTNGLAVEVSARELEWHALEGDARSTRRPLPASREPGAAVTRWQARAAGRSGVLLARLVRGDSGLVFVRARGGIVDLETPMRAWVVSGAESSGGRFGFVRGDETGLSMAVLFRPDGTLEDRWSLAFSRSVAPAIAWRGDDPFVAVAATDVGDRWTVLPLSDRGAAATLGRATGSIPSGCAEARAADTFDAYLGYGPDVALSGAGMIGFLGVSSSLELGADRVCIRAFDVGTRPDTGRADASPAGRLHATAAGTFEGTLEGAGARRVVRCTFVPAATPFRCDE